MLVQRLMIICFLVLFAPLTFAEGANTNKDTTIEDVKISFEEVNQARKKMLAAEARVRMAKLREELKEVSDNNDVILLSMEQFISEGRAYEWLSLYKSAERLDGATSEQTDRARILLVKAKIKRVNSFSEAELKQRIDKIKKRKGL